MDELISVDPNEIESAPNDEIVILKDADEVERFKAEKEAIRNNAKESVVESIEVPVDKTYMEKFMDKNRIFRWEPIVEEADELFEYLLHNYDNMLDGEDKVKHFDVGYGYYWLMSDAYKIRNQYNDEIQHMLVPWIRNEFQSDELFRLENWRPFRDQDLTTIMFLGYRKLFQFKHYYFQLTISSSCENITSVCKYCEKEDYGRHFGVALYGWRDISHMNLQPVNVLHILDDNLIPEKRWFEKE